MRGFGEIAEKLRRSTVQVYADKRRGGGSGVIWKSDGLVVTNAHVARQSKAKVELWDGQTFDAKVVSHDAGRDLAALRLARAGELQAVSHGNSTAVRAGELVLAIGSPLGFSGALSTGVVHSVGPVGGMGRQNWIRANVRLAPGNSGGPLANSSGDVIGINTAIVNGLGLAVPSDAVASFLDQGARPSLGVTLRPLSFGLQILELEEGGAADEASLRVGDIIIGSFDSLTESLDSGKDVIRLQFFRDDRSKVREAFVRLRSQAVAA